MNELEEIRKMKARFQELKDKNEHLKQVKKKEVEDFIEEQFTKAGMTPKAKAFNEMVDNWKVEHIRKNLNWLELIVLVKLPLFKKIQPLYRLAKRYLKLQIEERAIDAIGVYVVEIVKDGKMVAREEFTLPWRVVGIKY